MAEVRRGRLTIQPLLGRHRPLQLQHVALALGEHPQQLPSGQLADWIICKTIGMHDQHQT